MMWNRLGEVTLREILWQDETFRMSLFRDLEPLKSSIARFGILLPPVLQQQNSGKWRILSGWRRLLALRELNGEAAECFLVGEDADEQALYRRILLENLMTRGLNLPEKALVVDRLGTCFGLPQEKILQEFLPLLGFGKDPAWLRRLSAVKSFSPAVQQALAGDLVSYDLLDRLLAWNPEERDSMTQLITRLHLGKNRQKELLRLLEDVARIQEKSLLELLRSPLVQTVLKDTARTPSQRTALLLDALRKARFPLYSRAEERFRKILRSLRLPPWIQLSHPPYFESEGFSLQVRFRDEQDLRRSLEEIHQRLEAGGFAPLNTILQME